MTLTAPPRQGVRSGHPASRSGPHPRADHPHHRPVTASLGHPIPGHGSMGVPRPRHVPALDGLRAIAVVAVVLYHLGLPWARGGFLGVDLFFVVSGFLITSLLLDEIGRSGRVDLRAFWRRRARRLVPGMALLLVAVAGVYATVLRSEASAVRGDVAAAAAGASNWWMVLAHHSYAESSGRPSPLTHLWSLAVEAQFYLVWPLVVLLVVRLAGRARVATTAVVGALVSTAAMTAAATASGAPVPTDPTRLYVGTDTHAMGLMAGAALAALLGSRAAGGTVDPSAAVPAAPAGTTPRVVDGAGRARRVAQSWVVSDLVGLAALAGVVAAFAGVSYYDDLLFRGGFLAFALAAAVLVAAVRRPGSRLGAALAAPPLTWLGTRSYGIYLWHWPVLVLLRPGVELPWRGPWVTAGLVALALGLAELSYRYVETPVRRGALGGWWRRTRDGLRTWRPTTWEPVARRGAMAATGALALVVVVGTGLATAPRAVEADGPRSIQLTSVDVLAGASRSADRLSDGVGNARPDDSRLTPDVATMAASGIPPLPDPPGPRVGDLPSGASVAQEEIAAAAARPVPLPPASAFGDSVMLGAAPALVATFPSIAVDARESRPTKEIAELVAAAHAAGTLGDVVVIGTGTNGPVAEAQLRGILDGLADRRLVVVLNDRVPRDWEARNNELFAQVVPQYENAVLADWYTASGANPGWLYADGTHLRPDGQTGYATWLLGVVQQTLDARR